MQIEVIHLATNLSQVNKMEYFFSGFPSQIYLKLDILEMAS